MVIDEVQRRPDLFPVLRVLVDRPGSETRFLILGSASPDLLRQGSESLAGRIVLHELDGFALDEIGIEEGDTLWIRGGFPRSFLAPSEEDSIDWRRGFVQTFLERDLPQLGIQIPGETLHRFWRMIAHYHGQLWKGAELARAFGVSASTVRRYLDLLTGALVLRQLPPWHENVGKRQVRSPKVYVADSGLLHVLLGLDTRESLEGHPKVGASWEGFVLREILTRLGRGRRKATSGPPTPVPSWTSWWCVARGAMGSRSSAPPRRATHARRARPTRRCVSSGSTWSTRESRASRWPVGSRKSAPWPFGDCSKTSSRWRDRPSG